VVLDTPIAAQFHPVLQKLTDLIDLPDTRQ